MATSSLSPRLRHYARRQYTCFETTFAINTFEPWEKVVFFIVFSFLLLVFFRGVCYALPSHLFTMQKRAMYYLWGNSVAEDIARFRVATAVKDL
ncbi:hypothetical protein SCLCIDRAFT_1093871 [Scleroderma citrinum Foug A]|uniref:Uncharacterized protein n=1 Tax=Scleroderma citrinum Foug A TaxID=1036808 RepID=A0A0C3DQ64_9AGAM|nr:hypothetical protein SCLCIDRAFT_1093871 [Scleroderma citrinum Foug A]